jgi:hypothetical protein
VTSTAVSDITQLSAYPSEAKLNFTVQVGSGAGLRSAGTEAGSGSAVGVIDTVSISSQSGPAVGGGMAKEVAPEVTNKERAKKEAASVRVKLQSSEQAPAKVEFVYNQRGELIVKYMDASDRLVYQIPSELMLFQREFASKLSLSVDANV